MGAYHSSNPVLLILPVLLFAVSCVSSGRVPDGTDVRQEHFIRYMEAPDQFSAVFIDGKIEGEEDSYFSALLKRMKFRLDSARVEFSYLHFHGEFQGVYRLSPLNPSVDMGTVFFLHGYFNHPATFHAFYNFLLSKGYTIVTVDLPGHGVSTGPRGDIERFSEYGELVSEILDWGHGRSLSRPWFGAGHSTGGAAFLIYVLSNSDPELNALYLASPLGRTRLYHLAGFSEILIHPFVYGIKTRYEGNFSVNVVPVSWFSAQKDWVRTHKYAEPSDIPVFLAWGSRDDTLDLSYSMKLYERLFPDNVSHLYPGGIHNLLHHKMIQEELFLDLDNFLRLHYSR